MDMLKSLAIATVLTGIGLPTATWAQSVEYYHLDAIGSIRAVTDATGQIVERHDYLPFGEEWTAQPGSQPLRFAGKERDGETGLDYFGARYYRSGRGRFVATDPVNTLGANLRDPQRWNRYTYARNNPLRYVDPNGENPVAVGIIIVAAAYVLLASPDVANAPGPGDQTFRSDQTGKLIANAALAVLALRGLLPADLVSPPDQHDRSEDARAFRDAAQKQMQRPAKGRPAAVTGGYNSRTGEVAVGCSGDGECAEDRVRDILGGDQRDIRLVEAVKTKNGEPQPVCERCEGRYGRGAFPEGTTIFKSDLKEE